MSFFSLANLVKNTLVEVDLEEQGLLRSTSTSGVLLSSILNTLPNIAVASVPVYSYIKSFVSQDKIKSGLEKLSELIDKLTSSSSTSTNPNLPSSSPVQVSSTSTTWDIPKGDGIQSSITRKSPKELGLLGKLPSNGTYTKEEAERIIQLRASGADTTAYKTRINPKIEGLIRAKAAEYGVNQDIAVKIAIVESGGNPNAVSSTGAIGIFQFTGATANLMGLGNRFNILDNIDAGIRLLVADKKFVGKFDSSIATYLALQIGGPNAKYILTSARSTKISDLPTKIQNAIRSNIGGSSSTVGDYIDANSIALDTKVQEQKKKPVYEHATNVVTTQTPATISANLKPPTTRTVQEQPTKDVSYISPEPTETVTSTPSVISSMENNYIKPRTTLDGVVRHKSGLYFSVS
jgi:hypothetical protein